MRVLVACEFSGRVRDAFKARGHYAISCDFRETEQEGEHYMGDVADLLTQDFDALIAFPPCTYLANSGVQYLHIQEGRWAKLDQAADFWTRGLPPLVPTNNIKRNDPRIAKRYIENVKSVGGSREMNRSRTPLGLADAIADQWGSFITAGHSYPEQATLDI